MRSRNCTCTGGPQLCPRCTALLARSIGMPTHGLVEVAPVPQAPELEGVFQSRVITLAKALGYRTYHTYRSDRSAPGWFDLAMARAGDKLVLAELKKAGGKQTEAQRDWHQDLQRIDTVESYLWYPKDYDAIVDILTKRR